MNMVIMGISPHLAMAFKALGGFAPMGTRTIKITVQRQKKNDGSKNPKAANVDPKAATEAPEVTNELPRLQWSTKKHRFRRLSIPKKFMAPKIFQGFSKKFVSISF